MAIQLLDPAQHDAPALRGLTRVVWAGLAVLLAALWWIQVASRRTYQNQLEVQAVRTVRIPAVRGRILDRTGGGAGRQSAILQPGTLPRGVEP